MPSYKELQSITCRYSSETGQGRYACPLLATYVVLRPPDAATPTPTAVVWDGMGRYSARTHVSHTPEYCREHAYMVAGVQQPF